MWKPGENNLVRAAFDWVDYSPILAAEPLGVGERWRLVDGHTVDEELGTSHDSRKTWFWGSLWSLSPFPSTVVRLWWTSQQ